MAIIYTYPKLTNPQGNELIVVSDVNNRNSTRLITIASIASLIPSSGGCSTAITGIIDSAGNPLYTPIACNTMELVSTDGTVDIASTGTGIDLTVDASLSLECATPTTLGGVKALPITGVEVPEPADEGTYYPVQLLTEIDPSFNCTAVVKVPDSEPYELPCTNTTTLGGIKVGNIEVGIDPTIAAGGTSYSLEINENCEGFIRVPSTGIECATTSTIGGLKVGNIDETAVPVTGSGTPTFIETNSECEGFVRIPSVTPYVLPCTAATTLGGIKAPDVTLSEPPEIAEEGTYYSIETITETTDPNDECRAVVKIPSADPYVLPCPTPTTLGGIKAGTVELVSAPSPADEGIYYPVQIIENESPSAADCNAVVRVPDSAIACATNADIGGIRVATGVIPAGEPAEEGTVYPVQVTNECLAGVRVPDPTPATPNGELLHSNLFQATGTGLDQGDPPAHDLTEVLAVNTPWAQIEFNPITAGVGVGTEMYGFCKRPADTTDYVRVVASMFVKQEDTDGTPEQTRLYFGMHNDSSDQAPGAIEYGWQMMGYEDADEVGGHEVYRYEFFWDILVSDLKTLGGDAANAGDNCYFYLKGAFDSPNVSDSQVLFGTWWKANLASTTEDLQFAAGPAKVDVYLLQGNKYDVNPTAAAEGEEESEGDKEG